MTSCYIYGPLIGNVMLAKGSDTWLLHVTYKVQIIRNLMLHIQSDHWYPKYYILCSTIGNFILHLRSECSLNHVTCRVILLVK